jgi:Right handed beta helix region
VDTRRRFTPSGVWITGASSDIALRALDVHDIRTAKRGNAHGIAVYGSSGSKPITGIRIEGNNAHDLKLGFSEAIVVSGNVDGWTISGNTIDDVDNIGIDAIGYEATAPRNDRARNGVIADNQISDVDTRGNAAYNQGGEQCRCAGGVYVDGGHHIVIERNRVTRANLGVELASEAREGATSDVLVRTNLITRRDRARPDDGRLRHPAGQDGTRPGSEQHLSRQRSTAQRCRRGRAQLPPVQLHCAEQRLPLACARDHGHERVPPEQGQSLRRQRLVRARQGRSQSDLVLEDEEVERV